MEISRTRTLKVNMGNYEHVEEFYRATISTDDCERAGLDLKGVSVEDVIELLEGLCEASLDRQEKRFVERAATLTADENSFIHEYANTPASASTPAPPKARRIRRP